MRAGVVSQHKVFEDRHRPTSGRTLIVGANLYATGKEDRRNRYKDVIGADMINGLGVDVVMNFEDPLPDGFGMFSHIECCSVLEHSRQPWKIAENLQKVLNPGGTIYVTVPFVWRVHAYPSDYWRMTIEAVKLIFDKISWREIAYGNTGISEKSKIASITENGHPYFSRTEVFAFGERV